MGRSGKYYFNKDLQYKSHEVAQKNKTKYAWLILTHHFIRLGVCGRLQASNLCLSTIRKWIETLMSPLKYFLYFLNIIEMHD